MLSSLATSESEDSAQGCRLGWPERLLDRDWEQTLGLADLEVVALDGVREEESAECLVSFLSVLLTHLGPGVGGR